MLRFIHPNSGNVRLSHLAALWQLHVVLQGELFPWSLWKGKYGEFKDLKALLKSRRPFKIQSVSPHVLPPVPSARRPVSTSDAATKDREMVDSWVLPLYHLLHHLMFSDPNPACMVWLKFCSVQAREYHSATLLPQALFWRDILLHMCVGRQLVVFCLCPRLPEERAAVLKILKSTGRLKSNFNSCKSF